MFKNITFNQVTGLLTLVLTVLVCMVFVLMHAAGYLTGLSPLRWVMVIVIFYIVCYAAVRFFIHKFIFRKIKLIYKLINRSKQSLTQEDEDNLMKRSIADVNEDVVNWAAQNDEEIQYLTDLENYRRNFLGNISHELKTPIFSIQGYLHTLLDGGINDDRINMQYLNRAALNVDRLESIVNDLEMINRLESGKMMLTETSFDIKEIATEVIEDLVFMAREKNITLKLKSGASKSYHVSADQENIRQVLNNLVANSIKYGKEGGTTKISFYDMPEKILVEVSDDGIGISQSDLNHVFDRFYRVDAGRGRKEGGSGLGLAIVKHIMEAHNETINARSTVGEGSTFGFTLQKAKK